MIQNYNQQAHLNFETPIDQNSRLRSTLPDQNLKNSYEKRFELLKQPALTTVKSNLTEAEQDSKREFKAGLKTASNNMLTQWSHVIEEKMGKILGQTLIPLTTDFARSSINSTLSDQPERPEMFTKNETSVKNEISAKHQIPISEKALKKPAAVTISVSSARYTIQIQTQINESSANALIVNLQNQGIQTYKVLIQSSSTPSYAVCSGSFDSFGQAHQALTLFKGLTRYSAHIVTKCEKI